MVTRTADESALLAALRSGDQRAFAQLVDEYSPALLRVARTYVADAPAAEDVVQETWIAVVKGIGGFEGRSSLKTWLFAVLTNIAKQRGVRDHRRKETLTDFGAATVDPARFHGPGERGVGSWKEPPTPFPDSPEGSVLHGELLELARCELDKLPEGQRTVVTLRDMLGFDAAEVCDVLDISPGNQRVLLHRGRAAIRQSLEDYVRSSQRER
ncbi:RNA polymerase sigma factor [Mycobacterium sp. 050272]|uniref:RNA polymerase sigma factor n=1 Tax=Mycobacterium sp. 050272 TaxID=3142488 RepID=UPI00319BB131